MKRWLAVSTKAQDFAIFILVPVCSLRVLKSTGKSKRKTLSLNGGPAQESGRFLHQHHTSFADHRLRSEGGEAINKFWHDSLPSELSHSAELCLWLNFPTGKFYILCATRAAIYGVAAVPEGTAT